MIRCDIAIRTIGVQHPHYWCSASAPLVFSIRTIGVQHPHHWCCAFAR
nr:hypothetical protein [uncultured Prevotella sp.]